MEINHAQPTGRAKRGLTKTERSEHVKAWKRSGLSACAYAQAHGLRSASLYVWASKERRKDSPAPGSGESAFVPVRIVRGAVEALSLKSAPKVTLRAGAIECVIENIDDREALAFLAGALKREVFNV